MTIDYKDEIKRGEALFEKGDLDKAESVFKSVLQVDPEDCVSLNNLGVINIAKGRIILAEEYFKKTIALKADYLESTINLACLYQNAKRWHDASTLLERYLDIDNTNPDIYNQLGIVSLEMDEPAKACTVLERSLELKPEQPDVKESLDAIKRDMSEHDTTASHTLLNILFVQEAPCIRNYKMATALRSRGHNVSLAYTKALLSQVYKGLNDNVYNECIKLNNYRQLWDISNNYDIVHCHNEPDELTVSALVGETPVVHDTHDLISLRANGDKNLSYFEGIANRGANGRIYSTPFQLEEAKKLYGINGSSIVYYNYASKNDLPLTFLQKLSDQDGQVHIVYEGGIGGNEHRDFSTLFKALSDNGIHIHIYPTFYNQDIANDFSLHNNIHYYHPLSPKQIIENMTQYDFGIIPFNLEKGNKRFLDSTIANKLFEYLAAGLPVITSPLKTYIDFFQKNPVGITYNTTQDIIDNIPKLKKIASRTDFSKYIFTYEGEIERLEEFYYKVLDIQDEKTTTQEITESAQDHIQNSCDRLITWITNNGWDGYDPYDIQDYFIQKNKAGTPVAPKLQERILENANTDPINAREVLGIKKKRNAKALGLLTSAWVRLYKVTNDKKYLYEAEEISDWLLNNPSKGYNNLCWGYPFDWQSVIFIPIDTPSAVVTTTVGDGLWQLYTVTRNNKYLKACESICRFITEDLKMDDMNNNGICFSYTPIDEYHVHNANLFCGEFLARIGKEVENAKWIRLAERTADYAISEQNDNGSIYYWGRIQNNYAPDKLDHYHSGFEIRCLFNISQHTQQENIKHACLKYLKFYLINYFLTDGTPKISPDSPYPVNIHGAAESILLLSTLSREYENLFPLAQRSLHWTIANMQNPEGWFGYLWTPKQRVDAPFLRWGQAWMLRAFAEYQVAEKTISGEWGYYSRLNSNPGRKAKLTSSASHDDELEELRQLALSYSKMDNGKVPIHVIDMITDKMNMDISPEKKKKFALDSINDPVKWKKNVVGSVEPQQPDAASGNKEYTPEANCQIMMPETKDLQYGSKEWAESLFRNSENDPWGHDWRASQKVRHQSALDLIKKHVSTGKIKNILDIGCALGSFTKILKEYFSNGDILGVDIADEAILKCRKKFDNISFESSSLPELELSRRGFDLVSALEVIYYVEEDMIEKSLQRIHDMLVKGGYVLISTYLNKPPFVTSDNFKNSLSKYFTIVDESIRYHGLYSQCETLVRQSMDAIQRLTQIAESGPRLAINEYIESGVKLLGNKELLHNLNEYSRRNMGSKAISHSIILAVKK
ncbi:MAG: methyltransferase domain-containing protein [Candidatus Brocadiaceae bacterium]|nr:methyltransferase domain-containing protein [Candidatus Brocadiaceae bacterium]